MVIIIMELMVNIFKTYFFYRNGILIHSGGTPTGNPSLANLETNFKTSSFSNAIKKSENAWGLFV